MCDRVRILCVVGSLTEKDLPSQVMSCFQKLICRVVASCGEGVTLVPVSAGAGVMAVVVIVVVSSVSLIKAHGSMLSDELKCNRIAFQWGTMALATLVSSRFHA